MNEAMCLQSVNFKCHCCLKYDCASVGMRRLSHYSEMKHRKLIAMSQGLSFAWDESAVCEAPQLHESVSPPPTDLRRPGKFHPLWENLICISGKFKKMIAHFHFIVHYDNTKCSISEDKIRVYLSPRGKKCVPHSSTNNIFLNKMHI